MAGEDPRDRILKSAAESFAELGYARTSIEDIASRSGVSKKTVYTIAATKADLFISTVEAELESWTRRVQKRIASGEQADELIAALAVDGAEMLIESPLLPKLLTAIAQSEFPNWREAVAPYRAAARRNIRALLALGVAQGRFRSDLDIDEVAPIIHELQMGRALIEAYGAGPDALRRRAKAIGELILSGLRGSAGEP